VSFPTVDDMKFKLLIAFIITAAGVFTIHAQKVQDLSPAEQEVRRLERAWLDAYEKRDVTAMTAIVADDFTITFPDGSVQTKPQIIESIKRPGGSSQKFYTDAVQSRAYGDTVILIGIVVSEWKQNDKPMTDRSRYTDTYVKRSGKWQVVASHLSSAGK
jgi:ketosteroid isomerase-like protein